MAATPHQRNARKQGQRLAAIARAKRMLNLRRKAEPLIPDSVLKQLAALNLPANEFRISSLSGKTFARRMMRRSRIALYHVVSSAPTRRIGPRRAGTCHDQGGALIMTKMIVFRGRDARVGRPKNEIGRPKNDASGVK